MFLTKREEEILEGEHGEALAKLMKVLVKVGEINGAERLIEVKSCQISGVSYKTIGEAGLEFLRDLSQENVKTKVFTTLNPCGVDFENTLKFSEKFYRKQMEIISYYKKLGVTATCTCVPYLVGNLPRFGENIAWAESSSVIFANSVLGARTNRESAITSLAASLIGKVPEYGLHLSDNRAPEVKIVVKAELKEEADYSALGYFISKIGAIPYITNINPSVDEMKALGSAIAVGNISIFHIEDVTPESYKFSKEKLEKIEVDEKELKEVYDELSTCESFEAVCIGCPHASLREVEKIAEYIKHAKKDVLAFVPRIYKGIVNERFKALKKVKVISDTCMVVSPIEEKYNSIAVNSAKAAFYTKNLSKIDVKFGRLSDIFV